LAAGGLLLLVVLATAVQAWWTGWSGRLWLTAATAATLVLAGLLGRRRPRAVFWIAITACGFLLLVPAYLYGTDGGGLRIAGLHFDDVAGGLFLGALGLAVWRLASLPLLPWWGRGVVILLGLHAAIPVILGLAERIRFGEVLLGLWTLPYWLQGAFFGAAILLPVALVVTLLGLWLLPLLSVASGRAAAGSLAAVFAVASLVCAFEMNSRGIVNALSFLPSLARSGEARVADQPSPEVPQGVSASTEHRGLVPRESVLALESDVEAGWREIFLEVRDEIGFEPTRSALRSPQGVVLNGRGNSLEQARLLAKRLTAAGQKIRYVEGRLGPDRASALLAAALPAPVELSYPQAVPISRPAKDAQLQARLRDHYWIQLDQGDAWLDLDPSFPGAAPGERFAEPGRILNRLPRELLPALAIQLEVERTASPARRESVLAWEGQLDDLANAAVALVIVARVESESEESEVESGSGRGVFGALGGRAAQPSPSSETKTTTYEATLTLDDSEIARGTVRLAGGPLDPRGPDAVKQLDLRFQIRHPDGRRYEVLRPLFEAAEGQDRPLPFQRHSLLVTANRIPEEWFRRYLDATLAQRDADAIRQRLDDLKKGLRENRAPGALYEEAVSLERALGRESGHLVNLAFASTSDRLSAEMGEELSVFPFYEEPRILISSFQGSGEELELLLDLRQDRCAAISYPGQALLMRESFLYGRGVLESLLEGKVVELLSGRKPLTTAGLMTKAAADDVPIVMYSQRESARVAELELPPPARKRVLAGLAEGKIVALPRRSVEYEGRQRWGWWEIEPTTREAVGVLDTGLHQATVQRTLIESEGALDEDMAWVIGAITGATDTQWVLSALILQYGELDKAALQEAKAYLGQIGEYLCSESKVGKVWEEGVTVAEVKAEIEGCWEESYSLGVSGSAGGEVTILDKGWCEGFQKGFTCASMSILNAYLADA
jgi:hypothetical protein